MEIKFQKWFDELIKQSKKQSELEQELIKQEIRICEFKLFIHELIDIQKLYEETIKGIKEDIKK